MATEEEQSQEATACPEVAIGTLGSGTEPELQGCAFSRFTSRAPAYDHALPDQRINPRVRPAFPPRQRQPPPTQTTSTQK